MKSAVANMRLSNDEEMTVIPIALEVAVGIDWAEATGVVGTMRDAR